MSIFTGDGGRGRFIVTDNAKKAILAQLPSRSFDGTGDDYIRKMEDEYSLKGSFQSGIWSVKIDVNLAGAIVVSVHKPLEKRQLYASKTGVISF